MEKKSHRGQNKARKIPVMQDQAVKMCRSWEVKGICDRDQVNCRFAHSWEEYFSVKPPDIHWEKSPTILGDPDDDQFVKGKARAEGSKEGSDDLVGRSLDLSTECPVVADLGYCPYGWRCRFLGGHVRRWTDVAKGEKSDGSSRVGQWELTGREGLRDKGKWDRRETNWSDYDTIATLRGSSVSLLAHITPGNGRYLLPE